MVWVGTKEVKLALDRTGLHPVPFRLPGLCSLGSRWAEILLCENHLNRARKNEGPGLNPEEQQPLRVTFKKEEKGHKGERVIRMINTVSKKTGFLYYRYNGHLK